MRYDHTQSAPLYLLLLVFGALMMSVALFTPAQMYVRVILAISGSLMLFLSFSFQHLTVRDEGDHLLIAFGPLPFFRRSIRYDDIDKVQRNRSTVLDGWGIHMSPSGGWTWNLWGFDCVDVHYQEKRKIRIGTDDPEGLESFLQQRTGTDAGGSEPADP